MSLSPDDLLANTYCVHEVSKDLDGQTVVWNADHRVCSSPSFRSLGPYRERGEVGPGAGRGS
jgi:hypothetical protein